jgi:hypothetical protein
MRSISEDAPEVPMAGAYARQGRCRAAPAGAIIGQPSGWGGQVGQDCPGRSNPWRGRRDWHRRLRDRADGLEVRDDDGEAACVVEKWPGCFAGGSRPRLAGPRLRVARFASQADQHPSAAWGTAATVGDTSARLDAAPGVRLGAAPSALGGGGRSGPHTRPGTQRPANRRRFGERYRRSNPRQARPRVAGDPDPSGHERSIVDHGSTG